ncbi:hypothetical protein [Nitrospira sp. KM1]|uniref:hypothetical protein n=1 Tax=Nitrospira sp. KM1 TaxID=1936990 RepID=UPI001566ECAD|nr:hypothetical protein [Nitrospira sp. KM1]
MRLDMASLGRSNGTLWFVVFALMNLSACASTPDQITWIENGKTTRAEIVSRFGDPDLVETTKTGTMVTYQSTASKRPLPPVEIPTVQPGPLGTTAVTSKPIERSLGSDDSTTPKSEWITHEIHIRYDENGVVQDAYH